MPQRDSGPAGPRRILRAAAAVDLPAILRLEQESFADPRPEDSFLRDLSALTHARLEVLCLAESDGGGDGERLVGFIDYWVVLDELEVHDIVIDPARRGQGHGRWLLEQALARGRADGATRALLEVRQSNLAARALYAAFGFETVGCRRGYYRQPPEDALVLALELGETDLAAKPGPAFDPTDPTRRTGG